MALHAYCLSAVLFFTPLVLLLSYLRFGFLSSFPPSPSHSVAPELGHALTSVVWLVRIVRQWVLTQAHTGPRTREPLSSQEHAHPHAMCCCLTTLRARCLSATCTARSIEIASVWVLPNLPLALPSSPLFPSCMPSPTLPCSGDSASGGGDEASAELRGLGMGALLFACATCRTLLGRRLPWERPQGVFAFSLPLPSPPIPHFHLRVRTTSPFRSECVFPSLAC